MKKKIIGMIITILIIIAVVLTNIILNIKKSPVTEEISNSYKFDSKKEAILKDNFYDITYEVDFFELENWINIYYENCKLNNNENVLEMLYSDYINEKSITKSNISNIIENYKDFSRFFAKKIYHQYDFKNEDICIYYIYGTIWSDDYNTKKEVYLKVYYDLLEQKKYLYPQTYTKLTEQDFEKIIYDAKKNFLENYVEEEITLDSNEETDVEEESEEVKNEKEQYDEELEAIAEDEEANDDETEEDDEIDERVTKEEIAKRLYEYYVTNTLYSTEDSYNILSDEFKHNKFKTIKSYEEYIIQNTEKLKSGKVIKYRVKYDEQQVIYSVIDNNNFYYNFYIDENKNMKIDFKQI